MAPDLPAVEPPGRRRTEAAAGQRGRPDPYGQRGSSHHQQAGRDRDRLGAPHRADPERLRPGPRRRGRVRRGRPERQAQHSLDRVLPRPHGRRPARPGAPRRHGRPDPPRRVGPRPDRLRHRQQQRLLRGHVRGAQPRPHRRQARTAAHRCAQHPARLGRSYDPLGAGPRIRVLAALPYRSVPSPVARLDRAPALGEAALAGDPLGHRRLHHRPPQAPGHGARSPHRSPRRRCLTAGLPGPGEGTSGERSA